MIKAFIFENFKGFEKTELYLEDTTILIGANASGKSNALEGIAILAELARGRNIGDILGTSSNLVRGGGVGCCRQGQDSFSLGCLLSEDENADFLYKVTISVTPKLHITREVLYSIDKQTSKKKVIYCTKNLNQKKGHQIRSLCLAFEHLDFEKAFEEKQPEPDVKKSINALIKVSSAFERSLKNITVLSPNPKEMGNYSSSFDSELRSDCSNLSSALFALSKDEQKKQNLLDMIRRLPENLIEDIGFLELPNGDVLFYLEEKQGDKIAKIYANQLSDGTLRSLAIAAAMLGEPEGSVVVIDEVDTGIHPSRAKFLIEWLHKTGVERKIDVLVTTHNVSLLNSLQNETVTGVSVAYRDKNNGESKILSFLDLEDAPFILASGGIGSASENEELLKSLEPKKPFQFPDWMVN